MRERQLVQELHGINPLFASQLNKIVGRNIRDSYEAREQRTTPIPRYVIDGFENQRSLGSLRAYQMPGRSGYLERRDYLGEMGDYAKTVYNRGKDWFIERPYKGFGALGAVLGGIAGLIAGPFGVLLGGALGAASGAGIGTAYHWAWGRGKRAPKDPEFLKGRSFGKWGLDQLEGIEIQL